MNKRIAEVIESHGDSIVLMIRVYYQFLYNKKIFILSIDLVKLEEDRDFCPVLYINDQKFLNSFLLYCARQVIMFILIIIFCIIITKI